MKLKKIVALLLSMMMALSLVACGGSDKDSSASKNDGEGSSKWDHLDWSKGADASGGEVTLRVTSWRQYDKAYYEEIERRFEEKYDWIDVQLEFNANSSAYYSNIQADIMSGKAPDVMDLHRGNMSEYGEEGHLAPQTDFDYMKNYKEVAKDTTYFAGENYGFMVAYNYFGLIYNVDIFNELGLAIPSTPEELVNVVNALKKEGYGGISYSGATNGSKFGKNVMMISLGVEGSKALTTGIDDGSITDISEVEGVDGALETLSYYVENDIFYNAYEGISYEAATSLFAQKKAAIMYGGTYSLGEAEQTYPGINFGYFQIPTKSGNSVNPAEPAQNACISSTCENLGAAKLWVEFIATPEISGYFCSNSKMLSTIEGATIVNPVAQMILDSSESFVIGETHLKNDEYWSLAYEALFDNIMFKGSSWKKEVQTLTRKLEDYDLANL